MTHSPAHAGLRRSLRRMLLLLTLLTAGPLPPDARVLAQPAASPAEKRAAQDLASLARDHGLGMRGRQTPGDVEHVSVLLEAAVSLDPQQRDAWAWLYELAALRGDEPAADAALDKLKAAAPDDEHVFARWLQRGLERRQTLEQRREWLAGLFANEKPARNLALIHTALAQFALEQADPQLAQRHLIEARQLCAECPEVARTALGLITPETPAEGRLEAWLAALLASPLEYRYSWQVASVLDEVGLPAEAEPFYRHARELYQQQQPPETPVPGDQLMQLALNALARGDTPGGVELARTAANQFSGAYTPNIFLAELMRDLDNRVESDRLVRELQAAFAGVDEPDRIDPAVAAQVSWFYCVLDPQPERALKFAQRSLQEGAGSPFAQRVHGCALALAGQAEEAIAVLQPLAVRDPEAAAQLARLYQQRGDDAAAARVLRELQVVPLAGPTHKRLLALPNAADLLQSGPQRHPQAAAILTRFDRRALEFHRSPEQFVELIVKPATLGPRPGDPWRVEFAIRNRGPIPLALGAGETLQPTYLASVQLEGDRNRTFPDLLTVELPGPRVLLPGQTASAVRPLDIGPVGRVNRRTPQHLQRVVVQTIFDPVRSEDGAWQSAFPALSGHALAFNRLPSNTSEEAWRARFLALTGDDELARRRVIDEFAQLLGEHQRAGLERLDYVSTPIPAERIRVGLLAALRTRTWEPRAAALIALSETGFDAEVLAAVRECLENDQWVVRLLAVRLLGERKIGQAAADLVRIAGRDASPFVKRLATLYTTATEPTP